MKFIRKKIYEGYFKNPEEMKNASQKRRDTRKAELLARESDKLLKDGIENILNDALKRDYMEEKTRSGSRDSGELCFLSYSIFGTHASNILAIDVWATSETGSIDNENKFDTRAIVTDIKENMIELEIEVNIINQQIIDHIKNRQLYNDILCKCERDEDFFKKEENLDKIYKEVKERFLYDLFTGVRNTFDTLVPKSYLRSIKKNINFDFNHNILRYFAENEDKLKNLPIGNFLIDKIKSANLNFRIKKIHVFKGIEGDIVLRSSFSTGLHGSAPDFRNDTAELFSNVLKIFSFDNTGDLILRDDYSRVPEIVVKKGGTMNEGYFNNPEQAKAAIQKRTQISKAETLANTAKDLSYSAIERILSDFMIEARDENDYYDRFDFLTKYVFGDMASWFCYADKKYESSCDVIARYIPKVKMRDDGVLDIEIYVKTTCDKFIEDVKERQIEEKVHPRHNDNPTAILDKYNEHHCYISNDHFDVMVQFSHSYDFEKGEFKKIANEEFFSKLKDYLHEHSSLYEPIVVDMLRKNISNTWSIELSKIHVFSEIEGDVIVNIDLASGFNPEVIVDYSYEVEPCVEKILRFVSFENTGNVILRDSYERVPDIIIKKNEIMNEGYFKNPEEMKKKVDATKAMSKADVLARNSNAVISKEIEDVLTAFMSNAMEDAKESEYIGTDFFIKEIFGYNANYFCYLDMNDVDYRFLKEPIVRYVPKVNISNNGLIEIELYSHITFPKFIEKIKDRQETEKKYRTVAPGKNVVERFAKSKRFLFSKYCDVYGQLVDELRIRRTPKLIAAVINSDFYGQLCHFLTSQKGSETKFGHYYNHNSSGTPYKDTLGGKMLLERNKVKLKKIHMFSEVEGDIVYEINLCDGNNPDRIVNHSRTIKEIFEACCSIFSFENSGNFILRDGYERVPDIIIKKNN